MIEAYVGWPEVAAALKNLPPAFQVTLNDLLKAGRVAGSGLRHVRHNGSKSGRPLWQRSQIISYFARRWRHAPELHDKFASALRGYKAEMR